MDEDIMDENDMTDDEMPDEDITYEITTSDIIYNDIYETHRRPVRRKHRNYYLGSYFIEKQYLLFDVSVPADIYYKYTEKELCQYYNVYSEATPIIRGGVGTQIMQLIKVKLYVGHIQLSLYTVILKTFWIKILQRTWKKIFRARRAARGSIFAQDEFARRGRWPPLPSYRGALSIACGVFAKI